VVVERARVVGDADIDVAEIGRDEAGRQRLVGRQGGSGRRRSVRRAPVVGGVAEQRGGCRLLAGDGAVALQRHQGPPSSFSLLLKPTIDDCGSWIPDVSTY